MKKINSIAAFLAASAMTSQNHPNIEYDNDMNPTIYLPKEDFEIPPKGTRTYFFNYSGEFSKESMLRTEVVFKCFAINDKNAIRKFNKWVTKNRSSTDE
jgi:hypothetical protein